VCAAQFAAETGHHGRSHLLAILFTEQRHRPRSDRLVQRQYVRLYGRVLQNLLIGQPLDFL
jgi:hypothetical protein